MIYVILSSAFAYILGSFCSAVVVTKIAINKDIRTLASKNAGATNVMRVAGKKAAAIVFALDFMKGFAAVMLAKLLVLLLDAPYECVLASGFFAQLGHCFPVFFGFRGGKGVATAAGTAMAIVPLAAAILLLLFAVTVKLSGIVSVASGICAAVYPLLAYFLSSGNASAHFFFAACCSILILIMHLKNFAGIISGNENRINNKKP